MPYCSFVLAEMGADVIKIERPGGGDVVRGWDSAVRGLSTGFVWVNANKRDFVIDVTTPRGRDIVVEMAAASDVFLENFAPGVAARLGLAADDLCARNSRLVYCSLSGYGQSGPFRERKAYDLLLQGEAGLIATTGYPDAPAKVGVPIADLIAGTNAALAVALALLARSQTGKGAILDVAMFDSVLNWLGYYPQHYWNGGSAPPRTGMRHQYLSPNGPFMAADGQLVNLVVASGEDWRRFCLEVAIRPDWEGDKRFATVADRSLHRVALEGLVEELIASQPAGVWEERLDRAGLAYGRVREVAEVMEHPQARARHLFVDVDSPVGLLQIVRFALAPPDSPRRIPALGEHTESILTTLGYSTDDILELRREGVIQ